jgi:hypothetical protein
VAGCWNPIFGRHGLGLDLAGIARIATSLPVTAPPESLIVMVPT